MQSDLGNSKGGIVLGLQTGAVVWDAYDGRKLCIPLLD
jgi:hypothetical protein